jgi:16S rRNA processing protein RimM
LVQAVACVLLPESGIEPLKDAKARFLVVGRIVAPRGVVGELKVDLLSGAPERFGDLRRVYLGDKYLACTVRRARVHLGQGLLLVDQIADREAAEAWRDALVYVAIEDAPPLAPDEYLVDDIIGLRVVTEEGEVLGAVAEIIHTPANDVYAVRGGGGGELLLPAIKQVVVAVDLQAGVMTVRLLDGLR